MFKQGVEDNVNEIVRVLRRVGVDAVNRARQDGSYKDQTGNLRGSTGYLVAVDGQIVDSLFDNSFGEQFAVQILAENLDNIVLIVVAGMNYASYVEARGYNVLASAQLGAEREIEKLFEALRGNSN